MLFADKLRPGDLVSFRSQHTCGSRTLEGYPAQGSWYDKANNVVVITVAEATSRYTMSDYIACVLHPSFGILWVSAVDIDLVE